MQIKKEEACGRLYLAYQYSAGVLRRQNPRERAARRRITSEAKEKINQMNRKTGLMKLLAANFRSGRDLFIYLGWAHEPSEREDAQALKSFHRRLRRLYEKADKPYKYILVTETHARDGSPARLHHHLILRGISGRDRRMIQAAWPHGDVDVRSLRELTDNFEDTCRYLLKERKPKGRRAYSTSSNLKRPPEPLRRRASERADLALPPGVKLVREYKNDIVCGRYQIMMGKIVDEAAFAVYWERAQRDRRRVMEATHWARYAREKTRGGGPYLARNGV